MRSPRATPAHTVIDHQRAVLAAIARREWLLRMMALTAAGCARRDSRGDARADRDLSR